MEQLENEKRVAAKKEISLKEELRNALRFKEEAQSVTRAYEELKRKNEVLTKDLKKKIDQLDALHEENTILQFDLDTKIRELASRY